MVARGQSILRPFVLTTWRCLSPIQTIPMRKFLCRRLAAGADLLANALHSRGFVVDVVRDATRAGIMEAVPTGLKAEARPGSVVLVYFGGFGVQSRGPKTTMIIPSTQRSGRSSDVPSRRSSERRGKPLSELSGSGALQTDCNRRRLPPQSL